MKLAEALQERADLNRRIADLRSRLAANATVQEGESPPKTPPDCSLSWIAAWRRWRGASHRSTW